MLHAASSEMAPFAASYNRIAERTIDPGLPARVLARVAAVRLDRRLIDGADPASSTLLAARACRLSSYAHRERLADSIGGLLAPAIRPRHYLWVAPHRRALERQAAELRDIASLLRSGVPVYAQGIAMLGRLLADGTGPVYVGPPEMLARRLGEVRIALNA